MKYFSWYGNFLFSNRASHGETGYFPEISFSTFLKKVALKCGFNSTQTTQFCKLNQKGRFINDICKSHINHFHFQNLKIFLITNNHLCIANAKRNLEGKKNTKETNNPSNQIKTRPPKH